MVTNLVVLSHPRMVNAARTLQLGSLMMFPKELDRQVVLCFFQEQVIAKQQVIAKNYSYWFNLEHKKTDCPESV